MTYNVFGGTLNLAQLNSTLGVTPFEFRKDFWHQKTRVLGYRVVLFVFLCLAILVEHGLVTDRRTDGQTDGHTTVAYRAEHSSRGKNESPLVHGTNRFLITNLYLSPIYIQMIHKFVDLF